MKRIVLEGNQIDAFLTIWDAANRYDDDLTSGLEDGTYDDDSEVESLNQAFEIFEPIIESLKH